MTQVCCPGCRLRFTRAAATYLTACPQCGEQLQPNPKAERMVGFRLFSHDDAPDVVPEAVAIAMPPPALDVKPS
jgi:predicted amidophosphoribosyltransferase